MAQILPTKPQFDFIMSEAAYPAMVAGFGAGKSEALINRCIRQKLMYPNNNVAFYEPTYDLVRMIAWPRFEAKLEELGIPFRLIKSPHNVIEVIGYGTIIFRSMDTPQRIVGYEVADSFIDELDTLKKDDAAYCWRQIIARNRQKKPVLDGETEPRQNTIAVATTPEGFRFVYQAWAKDKAPGYELIKAPTESNPYLPDGYVQSLKDIYPEHLLAAYLNGEFVNLSSGTVYRSYNREVHRSQETVKIGEPLFIGMDFNVTKQAATVWVKRDGGKQWHAVDELVDMYDTPEAIKLIKERYQGHDVYVYPDASGGSRKSVDASISDIALLEQARFKIRANKSNPAVKDRIAATNGAFERGILYVNDYRCPTVAACLEQQVYDNNGAPDKKAGNDHQNDASTYPIAFEFPLRKPSTVLKVTFAR